GGPAGAGRGRHPGRARPRRPPRAAARPRGGGGAALPRGDDRPEPGAGARPCRPSGDRGQSLLRRRDRALARCRASARAARGPEPGEVSGAAGRARGDPPPPRALAAARPGGPCARIGRRTRIRPGHPAPRVRARAGAAPRDARHAAASLAYEAAAAHFQSALEVLGLARPGDERERCELLLARGDVQWKSGDGRGARETFQQAAEIARRIGDAPLLARSALGFAGEGSRLLWVRSEVVDQPRIELLEEALHRLGDGDPGLRAQLLARLAINLYWAPEPERVVALSEEAVRLARQLGDPRLLAAVLRARWIALWRPEGAAERLAIADEILHLGERTGDRELALLGHRFRIVGFLEHGDVVATDREIEAWAQIAGELRQPLYLTDLAMWRATRAIMDGRFADGEEQAQRAVELGQREPDVQPILRHEIQTFLLHFHKGCLDQLVGRSQPRTGVPATMFQRCARAFVWSETGRQAEARRELSALAKEGFPLPRDGAWVVSMSLLSAV